MKTIDSIAALEALYDAPLPSPLSKVQNTLTPKYKSWIGQSRFVVLTTVGPEGTDASPRGDKGPVATIEDDHTLLLPDWRGNNRLDSFRNIVRDGRVSLMFMAPGCLNVVRVNGKAVLSADTVLSERFEIAGKTPKTVIVVTVAEVYFQCAKAFMRSEIWSGEDQSSALPTAGDFIREFTEGFDNKAYDEGYGDYAKTRMW
jgi:PPOX class probable FMN-dependent enzyme